MSGFSSAGKAKYAAWGALFIINVVVLILSTRVNQFQNFFYVADLFPLALSAIALAFMVILTVIDLGVHNSFTARPTTDLVFLFVFSIFWMIFNAFSSNRWANIPMTCANIPAEYAAERAWCTDVQVLKAFVWVEWVGFFLTAVLTLRYVLAQVSAGRRHVWRTPLSRYSPAATQFGGFAGASMGNNADFSGHMAFNGGAPATTAFEQQFYATEQGQAQMQQQQPSEVSYYGGSEAEGRQYHYQQQQYAQQQQQQQQQYAQQQPTAEQYRGQTGYGATAYANHQNQNQYGASAY